MIGMHCNFRGWEFKRTMILRHVSYSILANYYTVVTGFLTADYKQGYIRYWYAVGVYVATRKSQIPDIGFDRIPNIRSD